MNGSITTGNRPASIQGNLVGFSDHLQVVANYTFGNVPTAINRTAAIATTATTYAASGPVTGSETITAVDDIYLSLTQAIPPDNFQENGAFSIYLAGTAATAASLTSAMYQSGQDELSSLPSFLSNQATLLATYGFSQKSSGNIDSIALNGEAIRLALQTIANNGGMLRLIFTPDESATAATYLGEIDLNFGMQVTAVPEPSAFVFLLASTAFFFHDLLPKRASIRM